MRRTTACWRSPRSACTSTPAGARIALGDSFEVVLRQPTRQHGPDKANILLHGIGVGAQRDGVEPREALRWPSRASSARSPLIAFHAAFDRTLIERPALGRAAAPGQPLARSRAGGGGAAPAGAAHALDDWLAHFGIRCAVRHQAAADTLATAELLLRLWPRALRQHTVTETAEGAGAPSTSVKRTYAPQCGQSAWLAACSACINR